MKNPKIIPQKKEFCSSVDGFQDRYWICNAGAGHDCVVVLHGHGGHEDQLFLRPDQRGNLDFLAENQLSIITPNLREMGVQRRRL